MLGCLNGRWEVRDENVRRQRNVWQRGRQAPRNHFCCLVADAQAAPLDGTRECPLIAGMISLRIALCAAALWPLSLTAKARPQPPLDLGCRHSLHLPFARSDHGFTAGFSDLPSDYDPTIYELDSGWRPRPTRLGGANGLYIHGHNRSDDLFMFWKRQLTGLQPNTTYRVRMSVCFVSSYRSGSIGIGGSPADSVFVKLGASPFEPVVSADSEGMLSLNLDKGNQAKSGSDAAAVGTVALPARGRAEHGYVQRSNRATKQMVTTDGNGSLCLFFGTDSGFEGLTELWYTRLMVSFARP